MKRTEFYLKLDVQGKEFNALELEKIIYAAVRKEIRRDMRFPEEDLTVTPIEFYAMSAKRPYSLEDYKKAKEQGLDLDCWNDYVEFYGLGEREEY